MTDVTDNKERSRFELHAGGHVVFADYRRNGNVLNITHVEAPVELRGTGVAGKLMEGMVELVRKNEYKIHPICPYAVSWLRRNPSASDIVD